MNGGGGREGGREAEGEREAQLTNRPISRDDEVLRLIPSSQKPLRDSIRSRRNIEPPSQLRGFTVLGESTEVFRIIVLKKSFGRLVPERKHRKKHGGAYLNT